MNLQNIISAGRMIAIVVALLGAFNCGAAFALRGEGMIWNIVLGAAFVVCGLALMVMLGRIARYADPSGAGADAAADADITPCASLPRPVLQGTAILAVGTLVMLLGVVDVSLGWRDPFSWMTALVGIVIFIDVLCLRISLSQFRRQTDS